MRCDCRCTCGDCRHTRRRRHSTCGDCGPTRCGRPCTRRNCQHAFGDCHHTAGDRCSARCDYEHGCRDCHHPRCGPRCPRCDCEHAFGDYRRPCCTSSDTVRDTCCSHHSRSNCQLVLGDCQYTCCRRRYARCDFQHILGPCQHTCCDRHYTRCQFRGLVLMALDCGCRAGNRHWHNVPVLQQVEKTEGFGGDGRPQSFFYPRSEFRPGQEGQTRTTQSCLGVCPSIQP